MKATRLTQACALSIGMLLALDGFAQEVTDEEWTGTLKRKGRQKESIVLNVKVTAKGPYIMDMIYADTRFEFKQQAFKGDTLTFSWTPGLKDTECKLEWNDKDKYVGQCESTSSDSKIEMQVRPGTRVWKISENKPQDEDGAEDSEKDKQDK